MTETDKTLKRSQILSADLREEGVKWHQKYLNRPKVLPPWVKFRFIPMSEEELKEIGERISQKRSWVGSYTVGQFPPSLSFHFTD